MGRRILLSSLGLLALVAAIASMVHTDDAAASPLVPCERDGVKGLVQCGKLEVFEDREAASGRRIPLKVVVLRALDRDAAPDPVFVLAGGPGQAVTDYATRMSRLLADVRRKRDIVLVDQRGTGGSNGLECNELTNREKLEILLAEKMPDEAIARCRTKLEKRADLTLYSTPLAMDDIDDVREWLGYETINLYGISYGTRAAQVYARRHPDRVRTVILRAVHYGNMIYTARDSQRSLDLLFEACRNEMGCNRGYPRLEQEFNAVLDRLEKEPASIHVRGRGNDRTEDIDLTRAMFAGAVRQSLYTSGSQRDLPYLIHSAYTYDYKPISRALQQHLGVFDSISLGMLLSVHCPETISRIPAERIDEETAGSFMGALYLVRAMEACSRWPASELPDNFSEPFTSDIPTLIISGETDPATPPVWGEEAARHLTNSSHMVLEGIAHDAPPPCAIEAMTKFIETADPSGLNDACKGKTKRPEFNVR